jgi:hypothetical protein
MAVAEPPGVARIASNVARAPSPAKRRSDSGNWMPSTFFVAVFE